MRQLVWLRSDLRTLDNSALYHALQQGPSIALYVISPAQWALHDDAAIKVDFRLRNVETLAAQFDTLNVPLIVIECDLWKNLPSALHKVCQNLKINQLHFNAEYGANEQQRDKLCTEHLQTQGIEVQCHGDATLFPPGSIRTQQGQMFKVFTAFKKACWLQLDAAPLNQLPAPAAQTPISVESNLALIKPHLANNSYWNTLWPAGEQAALQLLHNFCQEKIADYHEQRDFPALDGTSTLSPWLACGAISIKHCWHQALLSKSTLAGSSNNGLMTWLSELLWREFYQHLLALNPRLSRGEPYLESTRQIVWRHSDKDLQAWQQGQTGFPIIDAAMRQLTTTGWMHNRLRMIVAMFFSKNLLLPWQLGEQWFMRHLIDGDLAANNGGWQWCASTGVDAVPYFRIFNPVTQSQRFDPQGDFIRFWLPELKQLNAKQIHMPTAANRPPSYPSPIVDLKSSRLRAIETFGKSMRVNLPS